MRKLGLVISMIGIGLVTSAFVALMATGLTRRELVTAGIDVWLPALLLGLGGLFVMRIGSSVLGRIPENEIENSTKKQVRENGDGSKGEFSQAVAAAQSMGLPIKDEQTFRDLMEEVAKSPHPKPVFHDLSQIRGRIEIMMPNEKSNSWLGGRPSLPDNMAWPKHENEHAVFIGQFAVCDLPKGIWAGRGPQDGWLILFGHNDGNGVHVLHTTDLGTERPFPEGYQHFGIEHAYADWPIMAKLFGEPSRSIARWPVRIRSVPNPPTDLERPDFIDGTGVRPNEVGLGQEIVGFDPCDPLWAPFDGPMTLAMLEMSLGVVKKAEDMPEVTRQRRLKEGFDFEAFAKTNARLQSIFKAVIEEVRGLETQGAFTMNTRKRIHDQLAELQWTKFKFLRSLNSEAYFRIYEMYARHQFANDPNALPAEIRARFEPFWRNLAQVETGFIGGDVREDFRIPNASGNAVLLDIPSSQLVGWEFGDVSRLGVFVDAPSFLEGDLGNAISLTTHG